MLEPENPFAPPSTASPPPPTLANSPSVPAHKLRTATFSLALWTFVCIVSAAPSFVWGLATIAGEQFLGMVLGICVFIAVYTWADQVTQRQAWRHHYPITLTLKIGYITRLIMSVIFPIGAFLDLFCGLLSVGIVESLVPSVRSFPGGAADLEGSVSFLGAFLITLVQGVVLNIALLSYMTLVLGIVLAFQRHSAR